MICAIIGFILALIFNVSLDDVSAWWLLGGSVIGLVMEFCIRFGTGEEFGDAIISCIDIGNVLSDFGSSDTTSGYGGDTGSYDSGSSDSNSSSGGD